MCRSCLGLPFSRNDFDRIILPFDLGYLLRRKLWVDYRLCGLLIPEGEMIGFVGRIFRNLAVCFDELLLIEIFWEQRIDFPFDFGLGKRIHFLAGFFGHA